MIRASRRQAPGVMREEDALRVHLRIARRTAWNVRLSRAGVGALLGSVVAVAAGWPLSVQVLALVLGLGVGLSLPARGHQRRALAYVRRHAGLSYDTALEGGAVPADAPDPYGLREAVRRRAVYAVRGVRVPEPRPWWLPALAAAVALLLLPLAGRWTPPAAPPGASAPPDAAAPSAPPSEPGTAPALPSAAPDRVAQPDNGANAASRATEAPPARLPEGGSSDTQTLSRYLDSLRSRPSTDAGPSATSAPENVAPRSGPGQDGAGGASDASGSGDAPPQARDGSGSPDTTAGGADGNRPATAQTGPDAGNDASGPNGDGSPSDGGAGTNANDGSPQPGEGPQGGGAEAGDGSPGRVESGSLPGEDGGPGTGEAGNLPGSATPAGPGVDGQAAPPEFLQGVLRDGPETPGGAIRLPGAQDVTLPPGRDLGSYRRAVEQAVTEGDVPLEYQEVIRRYFR